MLISNIDTLKFSVKTKNYQNAIDSLADTLESCKALAKSDVTNAKKAILRIGDMSFYVLANGANGYAYILHNDYYQVKLARWISHNDNFYPIMIYIKQKTLWSQSPLGAYSQILEWVSSNFGEVISDKISRADLCCHTDEIDFTKVTPDYFKGKFRTNEVKFDSLFTNRTANALVFGQRGSRIYLRIYNKSLEIRQSNKVWFNEVWNECGLNSSCVWNVEYELKRDFMVSFNIDTVSDFFASIKSIWTYLTCEWLVLTNNDRTRIENATITSEWIHIQNAYNDYESVPLIKKEKQIAICADVLIPALCGYTTTVSALKNIYDIDTALTALKSDFKRYLDNKGTDFYTEVAEKRKLI